MRLVLVLIAVALACIPVALFLSWPWTFVVGCAIGGPLGWFAPELAARRG